MTTKPRVVVFGYHEVGYRCLEWLHDQGTDVAALYTHEDDPHEHLWFRSIKDLAVRRGIPVYTPSSVREGAILEAIRAARPDVIYSFYYRHMLPAPILAIPARGAYNMHGSLLPRYRGRVPINWAIINGERETGATLHHMVARADAGDIVDQERCPIGPEDTARDVFLKVTDAAVRVLARSHDAIIAGCAGRTPQDERLATTFGARRPEDGRIAWDQDGTAIFNFVRALTDPYPGAFSELRGERFVIWWGRPVSLAPGAPSRPGQVLSVDPLVIGTRDGGFRVDRLTWIAGDRVAHDRFLPGEFVS